MSTLFRRKGEGRWLVRWYEAGSRRQQSTGTEDRDEAERIRRQIDQRVAGGPPPRGPVVSTALDAYLADLARRGRAPGTLQNARHCVEAVGVERVGDLTLDAAAALLGRLAASGRSPRTLNHYRQNLRAFLGWCVRAGHASSNALEHLGKSRETRRSRIRRELTDEEVASLFRVADSAGRGLFYRLAFLAGLRRGEIGGLKWGSIDLDGGCITAFRGKSGMDDAVPIHPELATALLAAGPGLPAARVVPRIPSNATRRRDYREAGIPLVDERGRHADLHSARMTLHMRLVRAKITPQVAQRIMRHADYRTTLSAYTDSLYAESQEAMRCISEA